MEKILFVRQLCCTRQQQSLFAPVSFELNAGELLLVEGPNGSGKSSLLRLLCGLATPAHGDIHWQSQCIHTQLQPYMASLHYVSHQNGLKLGLTIEENLRLTSCFSLSTHTPPLMPLLEAFELSAYLHTPIRLLSAGQKRKVAFLKLFLFPKPLWILDEPLTALDAHTQGVFIQKLEEHIEQGGLSIISSHHPIHLQSVAVKSLRLQPC